MVHKVEKMEMGKPLDLKNRQQMDKDWWNRDQEIRDQKVI